MAIAHVTIVKLFLLPPSHVLMAMTLLFILDFLMPPQPLTRVLSLGLTMLLAIVFAAENTAAARAAGAGRQMEHARQRWLDLSLLAMLFLFTLEKILVGARLSPETLIDGQRRAYTLYATIFLCCALFKTMTRERAVIDFLTSLKIRPPQTMLIAYGLGTLIGALLLCLPQAVRSLESIDLLNAWFTATSAICVTGLVVNDVGTTYTFFGQIVIVALMQIGALGIMFFAAVLVMLGTGALSARGEENLRNVLDTDPVRSMSGLLRRLFVLSFSIEILGAFLLALWFWPNHEVKHAIWLGLFHSVSAFCNAGFCLFTNNLGGYPEHWPINLTVTGLVILGGLGIPVLDDLLEWCRAALKGTRRPSFRFHTRLVLWASGILIAGGMLFFFVLEYAGVLAPLSFPGKILAALFHSTARTSGFSTVDLSHCAPATSLGLIALMFAGGAPVSAAGGFKVTTIALLFLAARATLLNRESILAFGRRVPEPIVHKAIALLAIGTLLFLALLELLLLVEPSSFLPVLFEAASAFNTVGWSLGATSALSGLGKLVVILAMYLGRIGPLTLAVALATPPRPARYSYPAEHVLIG